MAGALLACASAAQADQVTGWKNWADHAERVVAAAKTGSRADFDAACIGTTKTMISQGFQFPYWAQMLPQFCGAVQTEDTKRKITLRGWMMECKDLHGVTRNIRAATDIPSEPRAKPLADEMVTLLKAYDERECSHPPKRE